MTWGATAEEWAHFRRLAEEDLLPVVSNPHRHVHPISSLKQIGKVPSRLVDGKVMGIAGWTKFKASARDVDQWMQEPDYGICLQTRRFRGIDIDVEDPEQARRVMESLVDYFGEMRFRVRSNSGKCLALVEVPGKMTKRVVQTAGGPVEFLADGQQCIVAGTHTSGVRYEWVNGRHLCTLQ